MKVIIGKTTVLNSIILGVILEGWKGWPCALHCYEADSRELLLYYMLSHMAVLITQQPHTMRWCILSNNTSFIQDIILYSGQRNDHGGLFPANLEKWSVSDKYISPSIWDHNERSQSHILNGAQTTMYILHLFHMSVSFIFDLPFLPTCMKRK